MTVHTYMPTHVRPPDEVIQRHPDDQTVCPEHTYPRQGRCDRIGTGIHAGMAIFHDASDVFEFFVGKIDIKHFMDTGELRRIVPDHAQGIISSKLTVELAPKPTTFVLDEILNGHTHGEGVYCWECDKQSQKEPGA